ncbi:hypothetical protein DRO61_01155 [Candidatus Bathyarchaeota archaeon]|nr:MAG: hypothetical protein DRO61_01155 [Candidatus Bathyarchaeota archaeon]
MLETIMEKKGIALFKIDGSLRNVVDVLEDMFLRLNTSEIKMMFFEMSEDEKYANIFDNARGRSYRGVE